MLEGRDEIGKQLGHRGSILDGDRPVGGHSEDEERHRQFGVKPDHDVSPAGDFRPATDNQTAGLFDAVDAVGAERAGQRQPADALAQTLEQRFALGEGRGDG